MSFMLKTEALPWQSIARTAEATPKRGWFQRILAKVSPSARREAEQLAELQSHKLFFMEKGPDKQIARGAFSHVTVLPQESVKLLDAAPGKVIVDCTLGGGGHSQLLLEAGATVIGIDQDDRALAAARERLEPYGERFTALKGNFRDLPALLAAVGITRIDGILADLGVSSHQLDTAERGFSFQQEKDGPLDMRMNPEGGGTSAADIVNTWPDYELIKILRELGEEPSARRVAAAICERRKEQPFSRTGELAEVIASVVRKTGRKHPATRTFQAIRMAVNDELGALETLLNASVDLLPESGRLAIITFHSLEDRMVKEFLRHHSRKELDRPEWPEPKPNPDYHFRLLNRKPIAPGDEETSDNPRARSSKLRGAERIHPTTHV